MRAIRRLRLTRTACIAVMALAMSYLIATRPGEYWLIPYLTCWAVLATASLGIVATTERIHDA